MRRFTSLEQRIDAWWRRRLAGPPRGRGRALAVETLVFVLKQAWACAFGAALLAVLVGTRLWYPADAVIARSDALVLAAVAIQVVMIVGRLETGRELWVVIIFHLVGTVMEVFKTAVGSWSYDPEGVLRIADVPLYSGFMYAAVGSYMVRVHRLFDLRFSRYPARWLSAVLAGALYLNFFTHHYVWDARWLLLALVVAVYLRCVLYGRVHRSTLRLPILLVFIGAATAIWVAENIATAAGAWLYPHQLEAWAMVSPQKIVAWFALMMISVVLVTFVYPPRPPDRLMSRPPPDRLGAPGDG